FPQPPRTRVHHPPTQQLPQTRKPANPPIITPTTAPHEPAAKIKSPAKTTQPQPTIAPNAKAIISNMPSDFFSSDITYSLSVCHPCQPFLTALIPTIFM